MRDERELSSQWHRTNIEQDYLKLSQIQIGHAYTNSKGIQNIKYTKAEKKSSRAYHSKNTKHTLQRKNIECCKRKQF